MAHRDPREQLTTATAVVSGVASLLRQERPTIEMFLKECRDMESFGPVVAPSLFHRSERRAVEAAIRPIFEAAITFLNTHDEHVKRVKSALQQVGHAAGEVKA